MTPKTALEAFQHALLIRRVASRFIQARTYQEYVEDKKSRGEKPMGQKDWEARHGEGNEPEEEDDGADDAASAAKRRDKKDKKLLADSLDPKKMPTRPNGYTEANAVKTVTEGVEKYDKLTKGIEEGKTDNFNFITNKKGVPFFALDGDRDLNPRRKEDFDDAIKEEAKLEGELAKWRDEMDEKGRLGAETTVSDVEHAHRKLTRLKGWLAASEAKIHQEAIDALYDMGETDDDIGKLTNNSDNIREMPEKALSKFHAALMKNDDFKKMEYHKGLQALFQGNKRNSKAVAALFDDAAERADLG